MEWYVWYVWMICVNNPGKVSRSCQLLILFSFEGDTIVCLHVQTTVLVDVLAHCSICNAGGDVSTTLCKSIYGQRDPWEEVRVSGLVFLAMRHGNLFIFFFYFILLYNTVLVLPYINMNLPWVYMSSQSWNPLPPPSPYHLSGSSQCTSPKHPVSCIKPRLAIHFLRDSIHVPMPFSQIIPP